MEDLTFLKIQENPDKILFIKKDSPDSWTLGEIVKTIGYKEGEFTKTETRNRTRIDSGCVTFENNCKVIIE